MQILKVIGLIIGLAIAGVGTFFAMCLVKAWTLAWLIFQAVAAGLVVVFFAVTIPIHEYFTKRKSK